MLTRDDVIDIIIAGITSAARGRGVAPGPFDARRPKGRLFLSEFDIKKRLTPGGLRLTIPGDAIISPLAVDWLTLRGIQITRE